MKLPLDHKSPMGSFVILYGHFPLLTMNFMTKKYVSILMEIKAAVNICKHINWSPTRRQPPVLPLRTALHQAPTSETMSTINSLSPVRLLPCTPKKGPTLRISHTTEAGLCSHASSSGCAVEARHAPTWGGALADLNDKSCEPIKDQFQFHCHNGREPELGDGATEPQCQECGSRIDREPTCGGRKWHIQERWVSQASSKEHRGPSSGTGK